MRDEPPAHAATGGTRSAKRLVAVEQVVDMANAVKRESLALREALLSLHDVDTACRADGDAGILRTDRDRLEAHAKLEALTPYFGFEITSEKEGQSHAPKAACRARAHRSNSKPTSLIRPAVTSRIRLTVTNRPHLCRAAAAARRRIAPAEEC